MTIIQMKQLLCNNILLKIISIFFGYSFWYIASAHQIVSINTTVPLFFTAAENIYITNAPETIDIVLQGKRSHLYTIDYNSLAAHVNISRLSPGTHGILISEQNLFLPKNITLASYKPSNITVTLAEKIISKDCYVT